MRHWIDTLKNDPKWISIMSECNVDQECTPQSFMIEYNSSMKKLL